MPYKQKPFQLKLLRTTSISMPINWATQFRANRLITCKAFMAFQRKLFQLELLRKTLILMLIIWWMQFLPKLLEICKAFHMFQQKTLQFEPFLFAVQVVAVPVINKTAHKVAKAIFENFITDS